MPLSSRIHPDEADGYIVEAVIGPTAVMYRRAGFGERHCAIRLHFFSVFPRKANLRQSEILPIGSMARGEGHQIPGEAIGISFSLRQLR